MRGIGVNTNVPGMASLAAMGRHSRDMAVSMERLSTGKRINRASDDPSGAMTVDDLKAHQITANKRVEAIDLESAFLGAKEGAASVIADLLLDLQTNVLKVANKGGVSGEEREAAQIEVDSILDTIDHLSETQWWGDRKVLDGLSASGLGSFNRTVSGENGEAVLVLFSLGDLRRGGALNLLDGDIEAAGKSVGGAVQSLASMRGAIGTRMQEMDSERRTLLTELEGLASVRSSIEDTDYAKETAELIRARTLQQASMFTSRIAQKLVSSTVLALVKPV